MEMDPISGDLSSSSDFETSEELDEVHDQLIGSTHFGPDGVKRMQTIKRESIAGFKIKTQMRRDSTTLKEP